MLFNFQGATLCSLCSFSLPLGQLIYYSTFGSLCQELFWTFFKFFRPRLCSPLASLSQGQPCYYSTFPSVCQELFWTFFKFFSLSFRRRPFSEQPCYYSTLSFACQVILKTFFKLLNFLCDFEGSLSPSLECLTIIPLFLTPVNPFSDIFSLFFSFSFLNYI